MSGRLEKAARRATLTPFCVIQCEHFYGENEVMGSNLAKTVSKI